MALVRSLFSKLTKLHSVRNESVRNFIPTGAKFKIMDKKKTEDVTLQEKVTVPVETDVNKIVSEVCGTNLLTEGGENVKIKPDSEYPDWLWTLHAGPEKDLSELDPNTLEYWERVRKIARETEIMLKSLRNENRDYK